MPYEVHVTPNPGPEPDRLVPYRKGADPFRFDRKADAERLERAQKEHARKIRFGGYCTKIVEV